MSTCTKYVQIFVVIYIKCNFHNLKMATLTFLDLWSVQVPSFVKLQMKWSALGQNVTFHRALHQIVKIMSGHIPLWLKKLVTLLSFVSHRQTCE